MPYLFELLLFLLPFAAFAGWRWLHPGQEVPARMVWALLLGIGCGLLLLAWYGIFAGSEGDSVYIPATLGPDGRIVPGHWAPRR